MLARVRTAAVFGIEASSVQVEVDLSFGIPSFAMVGLPDAGVRESRDRVRSAIRNSGYEFPPHRIIVNLAPADIRKVGSSFDLPIALGVLAASGLVARRDIDDVIVLGELSLDGGIHATRGVLPVAAAARRERFKGLLLPRPNHAEAAVVRGLSLYAVRTLAEAVAALNEPDRFRADPVGSEPPRQPGPSGHAEGDLADVQGQALARRAIEIAAAGGHNVLMIGPPGSGKTMMARRVAGILPPLVFDESLEVTSIHSVAGLLPTGIGLVSERPFRAPHHTISDVALVGGGQHPRPGEISLAHHGVLFLDEMAEFSRHVLEVLRQPLEEGVVRIARASRTVSFPARFMLIGAMNPCPCGFFGDRTRPCRCTPMQVARYASRLSGPMRDRMDLTVPVASLPAHELNVLPPGEDSATVRARVVAARDRQMARDGRLNARLQGRQLKAQTAMDSRARELFLRASARLTLTARGHDRVLRVARTLADLEGADAIHAAHIGEALQFRGE